uniref:Uncharacterized protein n=1 Tax=Rhizophora mucronata TaxID=61149 RepID=A0A2P2PLN2_RHIMU
MSVIFILWFHYCSHNSWESCLEQFIWNN